MSDSSLIQAHGSIKINPRESSGNAAGKDEDDGRNIPNSGDCDDSAQSSTKKLWASILGAIVAFMKFLFDSAVAFVAAFVTAVIEQENVKTAFSSLIVKAMNEFMDQPDFGEKFASAVRRVIYDKERRRVASRDIGKEVVPLVSGFVGGMAESLQPSIMKKKTKRVEHSASCGSDLDASNGSSVVGLRIVEELELDVAAVDKKSK